jgi:hypothetical protein
MKKSENVAPRKIVMQSLTDAERCRACTASDINFNYSYRMMKPIR